MQLPPLDPSKKSPEQISEENGLPRLSMDDLSPKRYWIKIVIVGGGIFAVLIVFVCIVFHRPILRGVGELLVYESDLTPSELLVVLSGGGAVRLERAIELYKANYAPQILITLPEVIEGDIAHHDLISTEKSMCEGLLKLNGIPSDCVIWSNAAMYSTYGEALFVREWMTGNKCQSAIVITGYFQSRRAKWSMDHAFGESRFAVQIAPAKEDLYPVERWWTHEEGVIAVENEYLKMFIIA